METRYRLYKYAEGTREKEDNCQFDVRVFRPGIFRGFFLPGENKTGKDFVIRFCFQLMTLGKGRIYYVEENGKTMHTSYVMPRCPKFLFLGKNDYEIGPCCTYPQYRGRGLYPAVLKRICATHGDGNGTFYMIVAKNNASSIRGIEKANFQFCGYVKKTKVTRQYALAQRSEE